jgi:hypothetical protein
MPNVFVRYNNFSIDVNTFIVFDHCLNFKIVMAAKFLVTDQVRLGVN